MKEKWLERFEKASEEKSFDSKVLAGFNAHIDVRKDVSELEEDLEGVEGEKREVIRNKEDYKKCLKYLKEEEENFEADLKDFEPEIEGKSEAGGQAGIVSNFLSRIGNRSILYTPFLSNELVESIDKKVLYPATDDGLVLKQVSDAVNTDRTKKNYILEERESSSRLILSNDLRGFGAYFRKGIEEKFSEIQEQVDKAFFSGFHDTNGNYESKLRKAEKQMRKMHAPKHLEFVSSSEEKDKVLIQKIMPNFTSVGMDDSELRRISDLISHDIEGEASLGDFYRVSKDLIDDLNVNRVHIHTRQFQAVVAEEDYPITVEQIRSSLVFAGVTAASMARKGEIPRQEDIELDTDQMHVNRLDHLEHFEDFFDLEGFAESGIARVDGYKVVAAPTLIHEDPERLVGLGDVMSSAAFLSESY